MKTAAEIKALQQAAGTYKEPFPATIKSRMSAGGSVLAAINHETISDREADRRYKSAQQKRLINTVVFDAKKYEESTPAERIKALEDFSNVCIRPLGIRELHACRQAFNRVKYAKFPLASALCWVCRESPAEHRHHAILLRNGGAVTARKNIVFLCARCHGIIYPWLEASLVNNPQRHGDFVFQRNQKDAYDIMLRAAQGKYGNKADKAEVELLTCLHNVFNILKISL